MKSLVVLETHVSTFMLNVKPYRAKGEREYHQSTVPRHFDTSHSIRQSLLKVILIIPDLNFIVENL